MTLKQYTVNVLIGIDQLANAIFKGDPDETISSRLGKIKRKYGKIPFRRYPLRCLIDMMLEKIDPNHCIDAIEDDEGKQ
jgi:hypothetical protein